MSKLTYYVPGEQPKVTNLIKLNTNEPVPTFARRDGCHAGFIGELQKK